VLAIAAFLAAVVVVAVVSRRFVDGPITPPALMIIAGGATGLAVGSSGPERSVLILLAEVTLAIVLFSDASRVSLTSLRHSSLPGRLLLLGLPLSMLLITSMAMLTLDLELGPALLLGAALSATDAALAGIIVKARSLPRRLRQAINVESGLNDGLATPIVTISIALMIGEADDITPQAIGGEILVLIATAALIGAVIGTLGGWLLRWGRSHDLVDEIWAQLATLTVIGLVTTVSIGLEAVTFVAAFVAGLAFRQQLGDTVDEVSSYTEDTAELLTIGAFFLFGLLLPGIGLGPVRLSDVVFALFALTIARMLPVAIAMLGTHDAWQTVAMIGWFGPRGLATALFGLIALEEAGAAVPPRAILVLALTVGASIVAHGATAAPLTRRYAAWAQRRAAATDLPVDPIHRPGDTDMPIGRVRR